jgi:hypothetical protein
MKKIIFLIIIALAGRAAQEINPLRSPDSTPQLKSMNEVFYFLKEDQTDVLKYSEAFNCVDFSDKLIENARNKGFTVNYVTVYWPEFRESHTFVAFYTSDHGIMWFEPQNDIRYTFVDYTKPIPQNGDHLCYFNGDCWPGEISVPIYTEGKPETDTSIIWK